MNSELNDLKILAGITNRPNWQIYENGRPDNTLTGQERATIQREQNIKPGTEAWFRLWFNRKDLTGETPI